MFCTYQPTRLLTLQSLYVLCFIEMNCNVVLAQRIIQLTQEQPIN